MTPEQLAARVLADVHPHEEQLDVWADELIADLAMRGGFEVQDYDEKLAVLSDIKEKLALSADHCRDNAIAAIARHLAPGDELVERLLAEMQLYAEWRGKAEVSEAEAATLRTRLARIASAWPLVRDTDCSGGELASAIDEIDAALTDGGSNG